MLEPIYGLKDAPRAWRKKLHQVLEHLQSMPTIVRGIGIILRTHTGQPTRVRDPIGRVQVHSFEHQEVGEPRPIVPNKFVP